MTKLRWHVVAVTALAVAVLLTLVQPLLTDALHRGMTPPTPSADPSASVSSPSPQPSACPVSDKLVPECGAWWGVAPGVFTSTPPNTALAEFEAKTDRHADIYHRYHRGDELFPTPEEIAAVEEAEHGRVLFINWKVAWDTTWADVASGGQDERIDRLAAHINAHFGQQFFLAIHHEPEDNVEPDPGSGMTAQDYAAMYRHTVERLRANGVDNVVFVMVYMGFHGWGLQDWFDDLYPGDDVVDWIGFDPYVSADPDTSHYGDFARLVNMTDDPEEWPGFYNWAVTHHPGKPLMLSEWGVFEHPDDPMSKAEIFNSVQEQLPDYPALKALVYFESPQAPRGDTRIDSSPCALQAFRSVAALPIFSVVIPDLRNLMPLLPNPFHPLPGLNLGAHQGDCPTPDPGPDPSGSGTPDPSGPPAVTPSPAPPPVSPPAFPPFPSSTS